MTHADPTVHELTRQIHWLRGLARELVADQHLAEDLVQDALVQALERPPRAAESLRHWLRSVLRNRFRDALRGGERREARERASARVESSGDASAEVALVELQRHLAQAVLELEEPQRSTLILRFYQGLPPREIARRQQTSVATVKSRLRRALERLRTRMDHSDGGRAAWIALLEPWALEPASAPLSGLQLKGLLMTSKLTVAGLLALSIAATWIAFGRKTPAEAPHASASRATSDRDSALRTQSHGSARSPTDEAAVETTRRPEGLAPAANSVKASATPRSTVVGRALDQHGAGLAGVELSVSPGAERGWSDDTGQFRFEVSAEAGSVQVVSEEWIEVRSGAWRRGSERPAVLILAPRIAVAGVVRDERGSAIDAARVALLAPPGFESRFSVELDGSREIAWSASCDAQGRFELPAAPALESGELRVTAVGFEPLTLASPLADERELNLELRRSAAASEGVVRGRVVGADGWPAADALVSFGEHATKTDRAGEFWFALESDSSARRITAVAAGQLPASHEFEVAPQRGAPPAFVELRLGGTTLEIAGRVVDEHGAPRVGGRVWVLDAERFGVLGAIPLQLEALLAGGAVPAQAIDSLAQAQAGRDYHSARPQSAPDAILSWATTDDQGRFRLGGLLARRYRLAALGPQLQWGAQSDEIEAGESGVTLVASSEALFPRVRGRVVDLRGQPVGGVSIVPWIGAFSAKLQLAGRTSHISRFFVAPAVRTDAQGAFELRDVLRQHLNFMVEGDAITPAYLGVDAIGDPLAFEIRVAARARLEIVAPPGVVTAVRALDDGGAVVDLLELRADGYSNYQRFELTAGRSGVLSVGTQARVLELWCAAELRERVPLDLRTGELVTITR